MRNRMLDDTTPEALAVQFQILRRMGPAGRFAMMCELNDSVRELVRAGIRHRHPTWDDVRVKHEVFRLLYGDQLCKEVYGGSGDSLKQIRGHQ